MVFTNKKLLKILSRTALILAVLLSLAVILTSCGSGTAAANGDLTQWAGENYKDNLTNLADNKEVTWGEQGGLLSGIGWFLDIITR